MNGVGAHATTRHRADALEGPVAISWRLAQCLGAARPEAVGAGLWLMEWWVGEPIGLAAFSSAGDADPWERAGPAVLGRAVGDGALEVDELGWLRAAADWQPRGAALTRAQGAMAATLVPHLAGRDPRELAVLAVLVRLHGTAASSGERWRERARVVRGALGVEVFARSSVRARAAMAALTPYRLLGAQGDQHVRDLLGGIGSLERRVGREFSRGGSVAEIARRLGIGRALTGEVLLGLMRALIPGYRAICALARALEMPGRAWLPVADRPPRECEMCGQDLPELVCGRLGHRMGPVGRRSIAEHVSSCRDCRLEVAYVRAALGLALDTHPGRPPTRDGGSGVCVG